MFKKSRKRIVAAIMGGVLILFAGTMGLIYFFSYREVMQADQEMLSRYAQAYWQNGNPAGSGEEVTDRQLSEQMPGENLPDGSNPGADHAYRLQTFHSVALDSDGNTLSVDHDSEDAPSEEFLIELSKQLLESGRTYGVSGSFVYYIEQNQGITLVVLMDNTILSGSMGTLFRYTLLFGGASAVLLFAVSLYISKRIVLPLEESYQKQKQFISDAGHELKTPLAVIEANAEVLEREKGQSKWLDNIRYEIHRMDELVRELLELARTEHGKPSMEKTEFSRIVMGNVLPFEGIAYEKKIHLQSEIADDIFVFGNAEQLGNMVSALLDNALDYAPENSTVAVELVKQHNKAFFTVANEGKEIPVKQREALFERFYRSDESREVETGHYGLGLAIAKAAVLNHGGRIDVLCPSGQVVFRVTIPVIS